MAVCENIVVSGDFSGSQIGIVKDGLLISGTTMIINKDTVDRYFVLDDESETGSDFKTDFFTGWYKFLTNQSRVLVRINFKNGQESVIQISRRVFDRFKNQL